MKLSTQTRRHIVCFLVVLMISEIILPNIAHALTSGPIQPEFGQFTPASSTDVVDLFSGNLNYNIPLFEVPGIHGSYPINLAYSSETRMEAEASMVGYGWSLNVGEISRQVQNVPDDFDGEVVSKKLDMRKNWTIGIGGQVAGEFMGLDFAGINLGATIKYNSYKGLGFSLSKGLNIGPQDSPISASFGHTSDSFEGGAWSANVSLQGKTEQGEEGRIGLGFTSNSTIGTSILNFNTSTLPKDGKSPNSVRTSQMSFETPSPINAGGRDFEGFSLKIGAEGGLAGGPVFSYLSTSGFYSEQKFENSGKWVNRPSFGSMYLQNHQTQSSILDFQRENEMPVRENMQSLSPSMLSADIYSVKAQGLNMSFTSHRSDLGMFRDALKKGGTGGADVTAQGGPGFLVDVGVDVKFVFSESDNSVQNIHPFQYSQDNYGFKTESQFGENLPDFEPHYFAPSFSLTGEVPFGSSFTPISQSYDYIGGNDPVRFGGLEKDHFEVPGFNGYHLQKQANQSVAVGGSGERLNRKPRTQGIEHFTSHQLSQLAGKGLSELSQVTYFATSGPNQCGLQIDQMNLDTIIHEEGDNKIGALSIVDQEGMRWNFGLPVMNHLKEEVTFSIGDLTEANPLGLCTQKVDIPLQPSSVGQNCKDHLIDYKPGKSFNSIDDSENFLSQVRTPAHAVNYLLTSKLSASYHDRTNDGPTMDDFGEWYKFDYYNTNDADNPYKWRMPFFGATANAGYHSFTDDNKASFVYGERDQYYIARIESPTHEAQFYYSPRLDNGGASCPFQNFDEQNPIKTESASYKLDSVVLFSKFSDAGQLSLRKIKTAWFAYSYQLWPGVPNIYSNSCPGEVSSPNGKLTLLSVRIKNYNSTRGDLNPYRFEYFEEYQTGNHPQDYQYNENVKFLDRWGITKRGSDQSNLCNGLYFPYTEQYQSGMTPEAYQDKIDWEARQYHLKSVLLPSGSKINFKVGRDHYSHVQNVAAAQMMRISGVGSHGNDMLDNDGISSLNSTFQVFVDLEEPLSSGQEDELNRYVDDLYIDEVGYQVFFKTRSELIHDSQEYEYITGYAYLEKTVPIEFDPNSFNGATYERAILNVLPIHQQIRGKYHHPFLVVPWQTLKNNLSKLLVDGNYPDVDKKNEIIKLIQRMSGEVNRIFKSFKGYYKQCIDEDRAQKIDLTQSMVKLCSFDRKKFGGDVQVQAVFISDIWDGEPNVPNMGQVYDYTDTETVDGKTYIVSSGVAPNEPYIGQEENSVKYVESYLDDIKFNVDDILFQEYPINMSLLPAASVGYRKVTVKSLAGDYLLNGADPDLHGLPTGLSNISSSGEIENEFYTSKDYPVIFRETSLRNRTGTPKYLPAPIFSFKNNSYAGSQGFVAELNDMHGKQKSVTTFAHDKSGNRRLAPIQKTEYYYHDEAYTYFRGETEVSARRLANEVDLYIGPYNDPDPASVTGADLQTGELGVVRSFYSDQRFNRSLAGHAGIGPQVETFVPFIPVILPSGFPEIQTTLSAANLAVTNKIINRTGIVERVEVKDGQSSVTTKNLAYDPYTGSPRLTATTNHFDDDVHQYSTPAYSHYELMGPAYQSWGITFASVVGNGDPCLGDQVEVLSANQQVVDKLNIGDVLLYSDRPGFLEDEDDYLMTVFRKAEDSIYCVRHDFDNSLQPSETIQLSVVRSGQHNQLTNNGISIQSLGSPVHNYQYLQDPINASAYTYELDSVLNHEAIKYSQIWKTFGRLENGLFPTCLSSSIEHLNLVRTYGEFQHNGFKPTASVSLNMDRANGVELRKNGTIDSVRLYNYGHDFLTSDLASELIHTRRYRRFSESDLPEEHLSLDGINQSSLTAYSQSWFNADSVMMASTNLKVTAQCENSEYHEIANQGFETYEIDPFLKNFPLISNPTHLAPPLPSNDTFLNGVEVVDIIGDLSGDTIFLDKDFVEDYVSYSDIEIYSINDDGIRFYVDSEDRFSLKPTTSLDGIYHGRTLSSIAMDSLNLNLCSCDPINESQSYRAILTRKEGTDGFIGIPQFSNTAHTGLRSLSIDNYTVTYQNDWQFIHGQEYLFSCWINTLDDPNGSQIPDLSFSDPSIRIFNVFEFHPVGSRIDGWQKIEGRFTWNKAIPRVLMFVNGELNNLLIDDIRIHPIDAQMTSYVYDEEFQRITHVLDENNYYTQFVYDGEGNLLGIKKETEEGIKTIQEQRQFIHPN